MKNSMPIEKELDELAIKKPGPSKWVGPKKSWHMGLPIKGRVRPW